VVKDLIVTGAVLILLVGLSLIAPPPSSGPADPSDSSYVPRPEWNFMFLYQALRFFPGRFEVVGTVAVPLVLVLLLVSLPLVDVRPERDPRRRPLVLCAGASLIVVSVALTIAGITNGPASAKAHAGTGPPIASIADLTPQARRGSALFTSLGCSGCHTVGATGGTIGPDLSSEGRSGHTRAWLIQQLRDPKSHNPTSIMPAFAAVSDDDLSALASFLQSQGAQRAVD
jgi:mono/diheme cytochrome c family protein